MLLCHRAILLLLLRAVHEYQKCTSMALSSTDCFMDEALRKHVSYFSSGALEDQGVACSSDGMPKAQRSQISSECYSYVHSNFRENGKIFYTNVHAAKTAWQITLLSIIQKTFQVATNIIRK